MSDEPKQMKIVIDGKTVTPAPDQTVLQAALDAGLYIPYLCYYPNMKPYGACRACVVEVEVNGRKMVKASCTEPCVDGMVVDSKTEVPTNLRRDIIELLMTEHPHGCLTCHRIELCGPQDVCQRHVSVTDRCTICPKNERCELKDTVRAVELGLQTPMQYHRRNLPIHADDPFYDRDYNLCIVCARCVRVCEEVRGDNAITMTNRSGVALVGTSRGVSLLESGCEFCGACVDVCPTGALVERDYKWEKAKVERETVCANCPVGCGIVAEVNGFDKVIRAKGDIANPASVGQLCFRGKFGYDYPNHKKRLKKPFVSSGAAKTRTAATWADAAEAVAQNLKKYKPEELLVLASPRATNEDLYAVGKFARAGLGTPNVMMGVNNNMSLFTTLTEQLGTYAATKPIWDIEQSDTIVVINGNPTEEQNVLSVPIKKAASGGAELIVIDSRETELSRYAANWLRVRPMHEPLAAVGMVKVMLDESLGDKQAMNAVDTTELRRSMWSFDVSKISADCGVDETSLRQIVRRIADSKSVSFVIGADNLGAEQAAELAKAISTLTALTDSAEAGKSSGIYPLYEGANALGANDMGCDSEFLPGGAAYGDAEAKKAVSDLWGAPPPDGAPLSIADAIGQMKSGKIRAALIFADGINLEDGVLAELPAALAKLDFSAVSTVFDSELTASADVLLPAKTYAEQLGTFTNLEGRVQLVRPLFDKLAEGILGGWETAAELAKGTDGGTGGVGAFSSAEAVMAEYSQLAPRYAGLSFDDFPRKGALIHRAEQPKLLPLDEKAVLPPRAPAKEKMLLARGRVLLKNESPNVVQQDDGMNRLADVKQIAIHAGDAAARGLEAGDMVTVQNGRFSMEGEINLQSPHAGVLYTTDLFGELALDMQNSAKPDRGADLAKLDISEVKVTKHGASSAAAAKPAPKPAAPVNGNSAPKPGLKK